MPPAGSTPWQCPKPTSPASAQHEGQTSAQDGAAANTADDTQRSRGQGQALTPETGHAPSQAHDQAPCSPSCGRRGEQSPRNVCSDDRDFLEATSLILDIKEKPLFSANLEAKIHGPTRKEFLTTYSTKIYI